MPNVKFVVEHHAVDVQSGRPLREIALELGVYPNREWFRGFNCGGRGLCGTCKVWVKERSPGAASPPNLREKIHGMGDGRRLACQTRVLGDIEVVTFPGGDDRTTAGRTIDPAPVRPEAQAEAAKPADAKPAKEAPAKADAKPAKEAPAKADAKPAKEADAAGVEPAAKPEKPAEVDGAKAEDKQASKPPAEAAAADGESTKDAGKAEATA